MAVNEDYSQLIKNQLAEFGEVEFKGLYGGIGIFKDRLIFAMIDGDKFRLNALQESTYLYFF